MKTSETIHPLPTDVSSTRRVASVSEYIYIYMQLFYKKDPHYQIDHFFKKWGAGGTEEMEVRKIQSSQNYWFLDETVYASCAELKMVHFEVTKFFSYFTFLQPNPIF